MPHLYTRKNLRHVLQTNGGHIMKKRIKLGFALILAIVLVAVMATAVSARRVSPWVGRWQTMDIPGDGSTNTLTITHGGSFNSYNLIWRETYFSICSGAPGIGRGRGIEDGTGLHTNFDFYCRGRHTLNIDIDFVYDSPTDTLISGVGGDTQIWVRISPRPW